MAAGHTDFFQKLQGAARIARAEPQEWAEPGSKCFKNGLKSVVNNALMMVNQWLTDKKWVNGWSIDGEWRVMVVKWLVNQLAMIADGK